MKTILLIAAALLAAGCVSNQPASTPAPAPIPAPESKAERALSAGVSAYEEGNYAEATKNLQSALALGGLSAKDQVRAYKYLAFSDCVTSKERSCRDHFRKALDINPAMELTPAEAGHPIWGPVFLAAKYKKPDAKK